MSAPGTDADDAANDPGTHDPDRQVGEIFRRLSSMRFQFGEDAFERVVRAVLQAMGAAAMREAERNAAFLREREALRRRGPGFEPRPRRIPVDDWDTDEAAG